MPEGGGVKHGYPLINSFTMTDRQDLTGNILYLAGSATCLLLGANFFSHVTRIEISRNAKELEAAYANYRKSWWGSNLPSVDIRNFRPLVSNSYTKTRGGSKVCFFIIRYSGANLRLSKTRQGGLKLRISTDG